MTRVRSVRARQPSVGLHAATCTVTRLPSAGPFALNGTCTSVGLTFPPPRATRAVRQVPA